MFRPTPRVSLSRVTYRVTSDYTFASDALSARVFTTPRAAWRAAAADYLQGDAGETPETVRHVVSRLQWNATVDDGLTGACALRTGETITVVPILPADTCPADELSARVEFDSPFRVWPGGVVTDAPADVYAPDVLDDYAPDGWEFATTGYTGQYGYNGPTMHPSEQLSGQLAADILAEPGTYVLTTSHATGDPVDVELSAEDIPDDFPVRPLGEFEPIGADIVTCGVCGLSWDDSVSTSRTPTPSGRCPFEAFHDYYDEDTAAGWVIVRQS